MAIRPVWFAAIRPSRMYPACEIEEYASRRFTFDWVIAATFPTVMVSAETTLMMMSQCGRSENSAIMNNRTIMANDAAFTATDIYAVIEVGAPS